MSPNHTIRALSVAFLLALPLALALPLHRASAQEGGQEMESREGIALQNQIAELRAEVESLRNAQSNPPPPAQAPAPSDSENAPPPAPAAGTSDITAQLLVRVTALEEKTRELQGKIDDLTNQLQHAQDELSKQIGDINFKLNPNGTPGATAPAAPGAPLAAPPGASPDAPAAAGGDLAVPADPTEAPPPPPPAPRRTPEMSLRAGNAALARRDYPAAVAAATEVLKLGMGPHTTDAELLLARAKQGQKQWKEAATGFYSVYKRGPKGPEAPLALLGVANALIGLGKNKDACSALSKLTLEFPKASPTIREIAKQDRKRAACG